MSKLSDLVVFGDTQDSSPCDVRTQSVRLLRTAMRWVLAASLLGVAFSGVMTYREYVSSEPVCTSPGPAGSVFAVPPCVLGLALYAVLVVIAALALARTRGLGDEIVDTLR